MFFKNFRETRKRCNFVVRTKPLHTTELSLSFLLIDGIPLPVKDAWYLKVLYVFFFFHQAGALVHVYTDGSVLVTHGGTEMGQGLHTKMVQVSSQKEFLLAALSSVQIRPFFFSLR